MFFSRQFIGATLLFMFVSSTSAFASETKSVNKDNKPYDASSHASPIKTFTTFPPIRPVKLSERLKEDRRNVMQQMVETMQSLTILIEQHEIMNQHDLQEVAMALNQVSVNLHELSKRTENEQLDEEYLAAVQKKTIELRNTMDNLLLQYNDN